MSPGLPGTKPQGVGGSGVLPGRLKVVEENPLDSDADSGTPERQNKLKKMMDTANSTWEFPEGAEWDGLSADEQEAFVKEYRQNRSMSIEIIKTMLADPDTDPEFKKALITEARNHQGFNAAIIDSVHGDLFDSSKKVTSALWKNLGSHSQGNIEDRMINDGLAGNTQSERQLLQGAMQRAPEELVKSFSPRFFLAVADQLYSAGDKDYDFGGWGAWGSGGTMGFTDADQGGHTRQDGTIAYDRPGFRTGADCSGSIGSAFTAMTGQNFGPRSVGNLVDDYVPGFTRAMKPGETSQPGNLLFYEFGKNGVDPKGWDHVTIKIDNSWMWNASSDNQNIERVQQSVFNNALTLPNTKITERVVNWNKIWNFGKSSTASR